MLSRLTAVVVALACACGGGPAAPTATSISMSFQRASFYDAPFPSDDLRTAGGHVDISAFPDPGKVTLMEQARGLLADADGFGLASAIYLRATAPLDPTSLPTIAGSLGAGASVWLVSVDSGSPDFQQPHPIDVSFLADGGRYGAPNLLAILPLQGAPLAPRETYAAVVTTDVRDANGNPLARVDLSSAPAAYQTALAMLPFPASRVAGMAVFTTGAPTAGLQVVSNAVLALPPPALAPPTLAPADVFADYCAFSTTIDMPDYQSGTPPYTGSGGAWRFDGSGDPILDHTETARVTFTIPRGPTPARGWPLVLFVRTGGGGDRPLVERGVCDTPDFTQPITPGSGPAQDFARVGIAGVEVDGPLGGIRNPNGQDEEFLIFNVTNAVALRDNIRESAAELDLFARVAQTARFDGSACPGAGAVSFAEPLALMGHSMGAWIAPLVLASDREAFGAAILSGAGGSYVENIIDKQKPTAPAPVISALLDEPLTRYDPALAIIQWAAEPSDPQVYARDLVGPGAPGEPAPLSVLMLQGIVDHYILPSIADATSLSLGLDAAGPMYDGSNAELASLGQPVLATQLPLVGRGAIALPASANVDGLATGVVVQHPADAIEDGHEVVFQTEAPKHQYRCFLASWLHGTPTVPPDGAEDDPCN
nr:hypothetical protein [Kofleriaceae bacterium]